MLKHRRIFLSTRFIIIAVLVLSIFLRLYKLGSVPRGMTWDEAAIGYNGYAVLHTRRDEWLERLPVSFQSFGDYKAPLAIYANGIFTKAFGMNLWAVRFPFALSGVLAVLVFMLLVHKVFEHHHFQNQLAIAGGLLLSLSPWHLHFSRIGFESGIALTLFLLGLHIFLVAQQRLGKWQQWLFPVASITFFVLALYAYHSAKLVIPLIGVVLAALYWRQMVAHWKQWALAGLYGVLLSYPLLKDSLVGEGLARAGVTVFSAGLEPRETVQLILSNLQVHLSPQFLLMGETTTLRHGSGAWGVLLPTTYFLALFAVLEKLHSFFFKSKQNQKLTLPFTLGLVLILTGLLPAAITQEVPHANRAILALPGFLLLALAGAYSLFSLLDRHVFSKKFAGTKGEQQLLVKAVLGTLICLHGLFFTAYLRHYYTEFALASTADFFEGYTEAFERAVAYERGLNGTPEVDTILFTSDYGQPYIFALFVRKTNPIWYQGGSLVKYQFTDDIDDADLDRSNTFVVASGEDPVTLEPDEVIYGSDGSVRFKLFFTGITGK